MESQSSLRILFILNFLTVIISILAWRSNALKTLGNIEERTINVPLDHFHNWGKQTQTLQLRYLIDYSHFDDDYGCILFYAGGYKDVWSYYNKSGFVTQTLTQ
jgi:hypothetical protein